MFKKILFILVIFLPLYSFSQNGLITGNVKDKKTGEALVRADVFLNNATKNTRTDANGDFILNGVKPGEYDLIVSTIGFEIFTQHISVNENSQNILVKLDKKPFTLPEVTVNYDPKIRVGNLEEFKRNFIGTTLNARFCKIVNPQVINIFYSIDEQVLKASSNEFLIVENSRLGYRLKYLLSDFNKDYKSGICYYEGPVSFEELEGSKSEMKRWQENRVQAYLGSSMHFYRTLIKNQLKSSGFVLNTLVRKENTSRPPDSLIKAKIKSFMPPGSKFPMDMSDSLIYWMNQSHIPKITQTLIRDTLGAGDILKPADQQELFSLTFKDYLYVIYTKKHDGQAAVYRPNDIPDYTITIITLLEPKAFLDANGIVTNPKSVLYEGYWTYGIAELLPYDYEPEP